MVKCDDYELEPFTPMGTETEFKGVSTEPKPEGVQRFSLFLELDTCKLYYYDNNQWNEMNCCGDSPEPTIPLEVTITDNGVFESMDVSWDDLKRAFDEEREIILKDPEGEVLGTIEGMNHSYAYRVTVSFGGDRAFTTGDSSNYPQRHKGQAQELVDCEQIPGTFEYMIKSPAINIYDMWTDGFYIYMRLDGSSYPITSVTYDDRVYEIVSNGKTFYAISDESFPVTSGQE